MKKRLLAAIMSLCMIVSLLPVSALAVEDRFGPGSGNQTYDAYFYVRFPSNETEEDTHAQSLFTFAGTGTVSGVRAPNTYSRDEKVVEIISGIQVNPPEGTETEQHGNITASKFPDILSGGKIYVYEKKAGNNAPHTYTVEWYRLVSEEGYNIIQNGTSYSFPVSGNDGYCWHVDGYIQFNDRHSVTYKVQFPGEAEFSDVTAGGEKENENVPYVDYLDENETFGDATAPTMAATKEYHGEKYAFKGWYKDENCTQEIEDIATIAENITVYGKYEKQGPDLTVTKELETDTVRVGDTAKWKITITNNTNKDITVSVTDTLKVGGTEVTGTSYGDGGVALIFPNNENGSYDDLSTVRVTANDSRTLEAWYKVKDSDKNKELENKVTVTYDGKEYTATAKNTVLPAESTADPATDIFFFIARPTDTVLSGDPNDYRYLTHGGVINKEKAVAAGIDATGITNTNDESAITQYVQAWPTDTKNLPGDTNVGFTIASEPVGEDSYWTIDEKGNVTSFKLVIDEEEYTSNKYEIRWVKISHATTAVVGSEDIDDSERYHVDGMLYEKTTVENILSKINITKTVEDNLWPYNDNGDQMTDEALVP